MYVTYCSHAMMTTCARFLGGVPTVCRTVASCKLSYGSSQIGSPIPTANRRFHSTAFNFSRTDYYHILGVSYAATGDEIKAAYRAKALKLHPDHNKSPNAKEEFAKLSEAYAVLSDAARRQQYNTTNGRSSAQHQSQSQGSSSYGFNQFHGFEDFRANDADEFFRNMFRDYSFNRGSKTERGSHAEDEVYAQYVDDFFGDDAADAFFFRERYYPYSTRSPRRPTSTRSRTRKSASDRFCPDDFDLDGDVNVKVKSRSKASTSQTQRNSQNRTTRSTSGHRERGTRESVFGKRFHETVNEIFDDIPNENRHWRKHTEHNSQKRTSDVNSSKESRNSQNSKKDGSAHERAHIQVTVKLSFEQAVRGCTKEVLVGTRASCSDCGGSRNDPNLATKPCKPCHGSGVSKTKFGPFIDRHTCFVCRGVGRVTQRCTRCSGRGFVSTRNAVRINVPAGIADGDAVRSALRDGQEFSVVCRVAKSDHFVRDGCDVHSDAVVSLAQAALGGTVKVPGLLNDVTVTIPAGTQSHTKICLNGKGVPRLSKQGSGDHYVHVKIRPPINLTDAQRALLLAFAHEEDRPVDSTVEGVVSKNAGTRQNKETVETSCNSETARASDAKLHDAINGETLDRLGEFLENLKRGLKP